MYICCLTYVFLYLFHMPPSLFKCQMSFLLLSQRYEFCSKNYPLYSHSITYGFRTVCCSHLHRHTQTTDMCDVRMASSNTLTTYTHTHNKHIYSGNSSAFEQNSLWNFQTWLHCTIATKDVFHLRCATSLNHKDGALRHTHSQQTHIQATS